MTENNDILTRKELKENPFTMPEGYLDQLQSSIMARIDTGTETMPDRRTAVFRILKPAVSMAAMFLLIFGMSYGALKLTGTIGQKDTVPAFSANTGIAAIDEGLLNSSFIDFYIDDLSMYEEEEPLSEDEIIQYLTSELTYGQIAQLYDTYNIQ